MGSKKGSPADNDSDSRHTSPPLERPPNENHNDQSTSSPGGTTRDSRSPTLLTRVINRLGRISLRRRSQRHDEGAAACFAHCEGGIDIYELPGEGIDWDRAPFQRFPDNSAVMAYPFVTTPLFDDDMRWPEKKLHYPDVDRLTYSHPDLPYILEGLRISLEEYAKWLRVRTGEANGKATGKSPAGPRAGRVSYLSAKRKRPAGGDEEQAGDGQDDEQQGKKPRLKAGDFDEDDGPMLACPFYKRNPGRHSRCLTFRLKRVKDVKQHLKRKHQQPHYCAFCGNQFESQATLKSHERDRSCSQADFEEPEGISGDQRDKLASKVSRLKKEAEQWFEVWAILFPETQPPSSAYVESPALEILSSFREYWDERGEDVVTKHLQQTLSGITVPTEQNQLKEMLPVLLNESVGMLLDRFTQRYTGTPSSVPDTGVSSTPNSNAVQAEDTIPSTPSNLLFLNKSYPTPTTETAPLAEILKDLNVQQQDGSSMGVPSLPIHSSHLTFASSTAAIDHSELQEDYPEWTTAFPGILQDPDMYFFDTCFDSLVSQDAS